MQKENKFQQSDVRGMLTRILGKPNFILIHTDQQRADCVNAYGLREGIYTPYQDSICAQGVRFSAGYAACPVCIPQRLSLLTGQSPQKHGIFDNVGIPDLELAGAVIPDSVDGISFAHALLGKSTQKQREYIHGESVMSEVRFSGYERQNKENNLAFENGFHYLTDGKMKYIWFTSSGREQLFDLTTDEKELYDLSARPEYQQILKKWRERLIRELKGRPERFCDGTKLICGMEQQLSPSMQELCDQRLAEGKRIAYYVPKNMKDASWITI